MRGAAGEGGGGAGGGARRPVGARGSPRPAPAGGGGGVARATLKRRGRASRKIFPRQIVLQSVLSLATSLRPPDLRLAASPPASSARRLLAPAAARPLRSPGRGNAPWAEPPGPCPGGCGSASRAPRRGPRLPIPPPPAAPGPQTSPDVRGGRESQ